MHQNCDRYIIYTLEYNKLPDKFKSKFTSSVDLLNKNIKLRNYEAEKEWLSLNYPSGLKSLMIIYNDIKNIELKISDYIYFKDDTIYIPSALEFCIDRILSNFENDIKYINIPALHITKKYNKFYKDIVNCNKCEYYTICDIKQV